MNTIRRTIPRSAEAVAALRADAKQARSGRPTWLAAAAIAGLASTADPAVAHADPGSIQLRNGGRVRGDILAVMPNDRVVVMLPDGTSMTIVWADVQFVFDGNRVYDALGNMTTVEPQSAPPATTPTPTPATPVPGTVAGVVGSAAPVGAANYDPRMAYAYMRPVQSDPAAYATFARLPGRAGTVSLYTFGGLIMSEGILTVTFGSLLGSSSYSGGAARPMLITGSLSLGISALMIGVAVKRSHRRSRGVNELRSAGFFVAGLHDSLELSFDVDATADRLVPRLALRF